MGHVKTLAMTLTLAAAAVLPSCSSTNAGRVGMDCDLDIPLVGPIKGKIDTKWGVSVPPQFCGCLTFLGEDGRPLPDVPRGTVRGGSGAGVVPKGAVGWELVTTDEGCDELDCNPQPEPEEVGDDRTRRGAGPRIFRLVRRSLQIDFSDTEAEGDGRLVEFALTVEAFDVPEARAKVRRLLERRDELGIPDGVQVHDLLDLRPVVGAFGFLGYRGQMVQDGPVDHLDLTVNGETTHHGGADQAASGYWFHDLVIPAAQLRGGDFDQGFSNSLERTWVGDDGFMETSSVISWLAS